jgi:type IV pilus biogenesis protein CpaD/CtpE
MTRPIIPRWALGAGILAATLLLGGCSDLARYLDPYQKPYTWQPTGASSANLAAQLANPHDLVIGRGSTDVDTPASTLAVERVWQDHTKPLASPASTSGGTTSSGSGTGGGS